MNQIYAFLAFDFNVYSILNKFYHMFVKNVYIFRNLPVEEKERQWTDCCCTIIGAVFALTIFIIACASFNRSTLASMQTISIRSTTLPKALGNSVIWIFPTSLSSISDSLSTLKYNGIASPPAHLQVSLSNAQLAQVVQESLAHTEHKV